MFKPAKYMGRSRRMLELYAQTLKAAEIDLPVLIVGETGSGKENVAREIHDQSDRSNKPFVALNTGAMARELVASELFGHKKGSFTGATENKVGRFIEVGRGTLFLDEIGTMDDRIQISLLRVLESQTIRPVGSEEDVQTHARVIAATNDDLNVLVEKGSFREDLMYRLDVMRIQVPALREVPEEIPALAEHFLLEFAREYELDVTGFSPRAIQTLLDYPWPGNIRELRNVIAQACVSTERSTIEPEHLPARLTGAKRNGVHHVGNGSSEGTRAPVEPQRAEAAPAAIDAPANAGSQGVFMPFGSTLEEVDRLFITRTLELCAYNKTRTAKLLRMSRKSLYGRLSRWNNESGQGSAGDAVAE